MVDILHRSGKENAVSHLVCKTWGHMASCYATLNLCWQTKQSSHKSCNQVSEQASKILSKRIYRPTKESYWSVSILSRSDE